MPDKVKSVAEVVRSIPDGSHIALGGFAIARNAIVFAHEVIRQQKKNLTLSQGVMGMETDLLVGAGLVSKLIVGAAPSTALGSSYCINRARDNGVIHYDSVVSRSPLDIWQELWGSLYSDQIPALLQMERLGRARRITSRRGKCPFTRGRSMRCCEGRPDVGGHVQIADYPMGCWMWRTCGKMKNRRKPATS